MLPTAPETWRPSGSSVTWPKTSIARLKRSTRKHGRSEAYSAGTSARGSRWRSQTLPGGWINCGSAPRCRLWETIDWLRSRLFPHGTKSTYGSRSKRLAWLSGRGRSMMIVSRWMSVGSDYGACPGAGKSPLKNYPRTSTRRIGTEFARPSMRPGQLQDHMKSIFGSWQALMSTGSQRAGEVPTKE